MKLKFNDSQMEFVSVLKEAVTSQTNNSFRVVDAGGSDCRWRNGLNDWLRFFGVFGNDGAMNDLSVAPGVGDHDASCFDRWFFAGKRAYAGFRINVGPMATAIGGAA